MTGIEQELEKPIDKAIKAQQIYLIAQKCIFGNGNPKILQTYFLGLSMSECPYGQIECPNTIVESCRGIRDLTTRFEAIKTISPEDLENALLSHLDCPYRRNYT